MGTRNVALAVVFAALYVALGFAFQPISFLQIQIRVADALYPLLFIFGWPSLIGITVGQLFFNLTSPLGAIDFLSPLMTLPGAILIWKWGWAGVGLNVLNIALWVGLMLWFVFGLPFLASVVLVGIGEVVAEFALGYPVYKGVQRVWERVQT